MKSIGISVTQAMTDQQKSVRPMADRLGLSTSTLTAIRKDKNYTKVSLDKVLADLNLTIETKQLNQ